MMKRTFLQSALRMLGVGTLLCVCGVAYAQSITVHGKVSLEGSAAGTAGVTVSIQGTTSGTVTNGSGQYTLSQVPSQDTLVFSFIGYRKISQAVNGRAQIDVVLVPETSSLDQLVVIGYGTAKKKDLTGAVSSVNVAKLQKENRTSVQDALRSNVPGLSVGVESGAKPGGELQIRGQNSLKAGNSPLIVVDGVIYYGALSDINPQDIATVDVLKDASAAAVYGAKSASGVILITTKRGKPGKPTINFNTNIALATMEINQPVYQGDAFVNWRTDVENSIHGFAQQPYQFNDPRHLPANISQEQWMAYDNSSGDPVDVWLTRLNFKPVEIANYKKGQTIDWYKMMFQKALQQNYTLSLSGGTDKINYYWSGGYLNNKGIVVGDRYSNIQSRLKVEAEVTKFLTVGVNTQFADRDESSVPLNWGLIVNNSPYGSMYNDDSSDYRYSPQDDQGGGSRNPLMAPKYTDQRSKYYTLNSIIYGKVKLPFGITYTINFTPELEWYQYYNHNFSEDPDHQKSGGDAKRVNHTLYQWQVDNILGWNHTFGDHHFEVTLLANAEKYQFWQDSIVANDFDPSDVLGYHNIGAAVNASVGSNDEYSTGAALMGRLFYTYKERYMLTLSMRQDGYSAFGQKYPWARFPAAALGWVFTEEPFFKSSWLEYGKLRLSYGVNGNRDIPRYSALADLNTGNYLEINPDGTVNVVSQLYVDRMQNPELKWERTEAYNIGLDFSVFHGILGGSLEIYKGKTTNLLVNRTLPDVVGFANVQTNLGEVDNKGLEVTLNSHNINHPNFTWNSAFNFSLNRNSIVHLYGNFVDITDSTGKVVGRKESDDIANKWFIGHPIDAVWDIKVLGVYQSEEADAAGRYGQKPGDFKLQDVNGDGALNNSDRQFVGYSKPRFQWTLRNDFTFYKHFDLSLLIYSYWGYMASFNQAKNRDGFPDRTDAYVHPYWTPEHPSDSYARVYSSDGSATYSVYRNRNFIRLDNVALGYTFPKPLLHKASIEDFKVYFSVKNAALYAPDWENWDPDWDPNDGPGPTPRTFTLGFNLTL